MERVRPLTVGAVLVFALAAGTGCVTVDPTTKSVKLSVAPTEAPPPPATQMECLWQRRLTPLADAVHDGRKLVGLPGQMFLYASDGAPAEVAGDLTVAVYDETRRPNGVPPHQPEVWHFTKDVVKRLVTSDERFGRTYALFLPWPPHWKDVTQIRIAARYDGQDKATKLTTNDTRLTLDTRPHDAPVWSQVGAGQPAGPGPVAAGYEQYGAPNPAQLLQQAARGGTTAPTLVPPPGAQPAGYAAPPGMPPPTMMAPPGPVQPTGYAAPPGLPPTTMAPPGPVQPAGGIQPPGQPLAPPTPQPSGPQPIPIPAKSW